MLKRQKEKEMYGIQLARFQDPCPVGNCFCGSYAGWSDDQSLAIPPVIFGYTLGLLDGVPVDDGKNSAFLP